MDNVIQTNREDELGKIFTSDVNFSELNDQNQSVKKDKQTEEKSIKDNATQETVKNTSETDSKPDAIKVDDSSDLKTESELLKKRLDESRAWGHKKNSSYINAKKKMTDFLSKLKEDEIISAEEVTQGLSFFDVADDEQSDNTNTDNKTHPYVTLKQNLDQEFGVFKKYSKLENADEKYQAFFSFLPLYPSDEQEKIINYMTTEASDVVIDSIMLTGGEIYDNLYLGAKKSGGVIPFVKSLHSEIKKLQDKNLELQAQLDVTVGKVHNRSINSKVSTLEPVKQNRSIENIWQHG
jgi:hypothetical protein